MFINLGKDFYFPLFFLFFCIFLFACLLACLYNNVIVTM